MSTVILSDFTSGHHEGTDGEALIGMDGMELANIRFDEVRAEERFNCKEAEHMNRKHSCEHLLRWHEMWAKNYEA